MTTTNLPDGVTNAALSSTLQTYVSMDPTTVHMYFNDFDTYAAGDWTYTNVGTPTIALTSSDGGWLQFANGAADDDHVYAQLVAPSFATEDRKDIWFKARLKISDATQSDVMVGLYLLDTSPIASVPSDGIWFQKLDGSTTITAVTSKSSSQSTLTAGNMVSDTFINLGFHYNGYGTTHFYVDDVRVGSIANTATLPTVNMAVSFVFQNGEAVAKTGTLDYLFAAKRRTARQS